MLVNAREIQGPKQGLVQMAPMPLGLRRGWRVGTFSIFSSLSSSLSMPPACLLSDSSKKGLCEGPPHSQSVSEAYYLEVKSFVTEGGQ